MAGACAREQVDDMVDVEGARALARGLTSLAAAAEAAFERRDRAAAAAVRSWTGPLGLELARRTASEAEEGREVVAELRAEAAGWRAAAARAEEGTAAGGGSYSTAAGGGSGSTAGGGRSGGLW